ncbi:MAG: InlB B-repeat-containing protein, partial [Sporomusa sp.]
KDNGTNGENPNSTNSNGIEDIIVTLKFDTISGKQLDDDSRIIVDVGKKLSDALAEASVAPKEFIGYTYYGYRIGSGTIYKTTDYPDFEVSAGDLDTTVQYLFSANTYTITFDGNGGTDSDGNTTYTQDMTYDVSEKLTANNHTRTGYTFAGWSTTATEYYDEQEVKNLASGNGDVVTLYAQWTLDPSQTASIDVEYYFDNVHNSSYDDTITPQILATVNESDVKLATVPIGYVFESSDPAMPQSASNLDNTTVKVYYVADINQTADIDVEYYFDNVHDSSYDDTITPQILATVNESDVKLATVPVGYVFESSDPAMPQSASSLDNTTVKVYYVADINQTADIDIEYYFDNVHDSSYDTTITPQILATVNQSDIKLATVSTRYVFESSDPAMPQSASSLDSTTVKVYYVADINQTADIDIEYYFDNVHDSSYDTTITPQILATVNES